MRARACYFPTGLIRGRVSISEGAGLEGTLNSFVIAEEPLDFRFASGFFITVVQQSLSPTAFDYWRNVSLVTERNGNMFEPAPGLIRGNIFNPDDPEEIAFGYFYVTRQDTMRLFIEPRSTPDWPSPRCRSIENRFDECFNCTSIRNSSLTPPDYWD